MSSYTFLRRPVPPRDILTQDNRNRGDSMRKRPETLFSPAYREANKRKWLAALKDYEKEQRAKRIKVEVRF